MEKIKCLNRYQKGILLLMSVMIVVFAVIYPIMIAREGFLYKNNILIPHHENGNITYSGKIQGKSARFTVSADKAVVFQCADKTYGPYTAKEDPTAIPKHADDSDQMTGIELRDGTEIVFRGGSLDFGNYRWLYNEDGDLDNLGISVTINGIEQDENGNTINPMEPSVSTLLDLMEGPTLTQKGAWFGLFFGIFACLLTALSILFADELFRWNLSFQIRDAAQAEPSDLEIATRYIAWTVLPIIALVLFMIGLQ